MSFEEEVPGLHSLVEQIRSTEKTPEGRVSVLSVSDQVSRLFVRVSDLFVSPLFSKQR